MIAHINLKRLLALQNLIIIVLKILMLVTKTSADGNDTYKADNAENVSVTALEDNLFNSIDSTLGNFDAVKLLRNNINETEDPCNDFYNFACGGYIQKSVIPENQYSASLMYDVQMKVYQEIKQSLEEEVNSTEPRIFELAKNYYKACTDEARLSHGLKTLLQNIDVLGGWPVLVGDSWDASKFDPFETDHKLRKLGYNPKSLFSLDVYNGVFDTSRNILYFENPSGGIENKYFKRGFMNEPAQAYYRYMVDVAVLLGADRVRAQRDLKKAFNLERDISFASSSTKTADALHIRRIKDLEKQAPNIPWRKYVNYLTEPIVTFQDFEGINVVDMDYVNTLEYLLSSTPKKIIANYMIWKTIAESIPYLTHELREKRFEFEKTVSEKHVPLQKEPRWIECIDRLTSKNNGLMVGVSAMYIRKYFKDDARESVKEIVSSIIVAFKDVLEKTTWLDNSTKALAIRKSEYMGQVIGYPNELLNDQTIDDYTKDLDLSPDTHYNNFLNLQRFHLDYKLSGLNKSPKDQLWTIFADSIVVNAYYVAVHNTFALLAALLQPPVFNPKWPSYMKFGTVGFIVGHEIMHGYDTKGHHYDEMGNRITLTIANAPTKKEYEERVHCFVDQFKGFKDEQYNISVDPELTLNDNIADNGGLAVAHQAYQNWISKHGEDPPLLALKYSSSQLFWISTVDFLCSKHSKESRLDNLKFRKHTPDDFRAIGMLRNFDEFAKDFGCPRGAPMNPEKKCGIW